MSLTKQATIGTYGIWKVIALDSSYAKTGSWVQGYRCNGAEFAMTQERVSEDYDTIFIADEYMTGLAITMTINEARWGIPDDGATGQPDGEFNIYHDLMGIDSISGSLGSGLAESQSDDSVSGKADIWAIGSNLSLPYVASYYRCYVGAPSGSARRIFELELCKVQCAEFTLGFMKKDTSKPNISLRCLLNSAVTTGGAAGTFMLVKRSYNNYVLPPGGAGA